MMFFWMLFDGSGVFCVCVFCKMVQSQVQSVKEAFQAHCLESLPFLFRAFRFFPLTSILCSHFNAKWLGNELVAVVVAVIVVVVVVFAFKVQSMGFLSTRLSWQRLETRIQVR